MFSANMTPFADFKLAFDLGAIINLDDITDLEYFPRLPAVPKKACLRYNPGGSFQISNEIMDSPAEAKYGLTRPQLTSAVRRLLKLGVEEFGLHAFLTSNTTTEQYYPILAELLFDLVRELTEETGARFTFVNLSGGIGIPPYRPEQREVDIMAVGTGGVQKAFTDILVPAGLGGDVAILAELGRYMLGPYGHLVATAIREKKSTNTISAWMPAPLT